jgi:hypothetical protein
MIIKIIFITKPKVISANVAIAVDSSAVEEFSVQNLNSASLKGGRYVEKDDPTSEIFYYY